MKANHGRLVFGVTYHGSLAESLTGLDNFYGKHISAGKLRAQLAWLRRHFQILTIGEIFDRLQRGNLPRRTAFIAFHDGYAGNYDVAFPMLKELGIKAGFYIPTAFMGTSERFWVDVLDAALKHTRTPRLAKELSGNMEALPLTNEPQRLSAAGTLRRRLKSLPQQVMETEFQRLIAALGWNNPADVPPLGAHDRCMTWDQVEEMARAGMEIGSHTHRHLICALQDETTLREELTQSKKLIEAHLQSECRYFCYPNGDYPKSGNEYTDRIVRECGYQAILYMISPYNYLHAQSFRLTGVAIGEDTTDEKFKRALSTLRFHWKRLRKSPIWPWDSEPETTTGL